MTSTQPLPAGFGVVLDRHTRVLHGGRVLLGGRPRRALRLSDRGAAAFARLRATGFVGDPTTGRLARRLIAAGVAHPRPPAVTGAVVPVVLPVRDRPAALERCLAALHGAGVVVVDDGSADPAAIAAVAHRHGARLIRRPRNGGPAAARNTGLAQLGDAVGAVGDAELVAFVDSDCVPPPGWLDQLAAHFADPAVGAVAPRVVPGPDGGEGRPGPAVLARFAAAHSPLDLGPEETLVHPGGPVSYVPTAALLVRRTAIGGFAEDLRYGEDVDAVWRLVAAGWQVRYDPSVSVVHAEPDSWAAWLRRRYHYGTSAGPLARRHPGRLAPLVLQPWPAAVTALLLARRPVLAGAVTAAAAARLAVRLRPTGVPASAALPMVAGATASTVAGLGRAVTQLALPAAVALAAALPSRRGARRARWARLATLGVLVAAPALRDWGRARPRLDPVRWTLARIADDLAYGAGVWHGALRARTPDPLLPRFHPPSSK